MYLKRESYVEVRHQGCLYSYFHVDGDDKNRYMSLSELLRYHPEAVEYVNNHRSSLAEDFNNGKVGKRDESGIKGCTGRIQKKACRR